LGTPVYYDNCGVASVTNNAPSTYPIGVTTVTWTVEDNGGNVTTCDQLVTVSDVTAPVANLSVLANVLGECSATPAAPTATDFCAGLITGTPDVQFPITNQGTTIVTWTYNDGHGNTATQTQSVIISDVTAPVANVATLADITAACEVTSLTAPTATDNCSASVTVTNDAVFPITAATTTITWTYDDGHGNTVTQTQNVIVTAVDVTVAVSGVTITANNTNSGVTYQWVDCDNANAPITGSTNVSYTATANGNYAVEVTEGSCSELSACTAITGVGVDEISAQLINVYPNPAASELFIEIAQEGTIELLDISGKLIFSGKVSAGKNQLSVNTIATGTYTLRLTTNSAINLVRLVINK
jgi:hypothetical protein